MGETCTWEREDDAHFGTYETSCGNVFDLIDGTPSENDMKFCCFCGWSIEEINHG